MKRKGETFTEFLTAAAVFGVMMAGIVEFMANQTDNLAKIRQMDDMIYYANWLSQQPISGTFGSDDGLIELKDRNILRNINHKIIAGSPLTYPYYDRDVTKSPTKSLEYLEDVVKFDWDNTSHILTVKRTSEVSMSFKLKP